MEFELKKEAHAFPLLELEELKSNLYTKRNY